MDDTQRLVMAGLARAFLDSKLTRTESFFRAEDLEVDDPVSLPEGNVVKITIEYVAEAEVM